jgi:hypothetical protein
VHPEQPIQKGYEMTRIKVFKSVIIVLSLAVMIGIGGHFLPGPPSVNAARISNYKVVSMGAANTVYEYEKLLNDMAFQGWEFDHMVIEREWAIFKK